MRLAKHLGISVKDVTIKYTIDAVYLRQVDEIKCVFLGDNGCEVHSDRPLVCRLFPLGRHIFEDGTHHFSNPQWQTPPNGEFGEDGTVGEFVTSQNAAEFIYFADEYFKFYCLLSASNATEFAFEIGGIDIIDIEDFTNFYCELKKIDRPQNPNQYASLHLKALYELLGQEYAGEMP